MGPRVIRLLALFAFVAAGLFTVAAQAQTLVALPPLARVTDTTNTLTAEQRAAIDAKLAAFELAHGSQIAVVMLATTQPEPIESYGNRLGEAWKIGRAEIGDGLLLIVARDDKRVRIEVARALEGAVPDAAAARIIREQIGPAFAKGDFYGGIDHALDALMARVEAEKLAPGSGAADEDGRNRGGTDVTGTLGGLFVLAIAIGSVLRGLFGRTGAVLAGAATGAIGWLLGLSLVIAVLAGLFAAIVLLALGGGGGRGGRGGPGGGFPIVIGGLGGFGGGGRGGFGGGGGGGFSSGGGGDFSGGGASGSWN